MTMFNALATNASALRINRLKLNLISENIANAQTTRTASGGPYKAKRAIVAETPAYISFKKILDSNSDSLPYRNPTIKGIFLDNKPPIQKYDPSHPDANENGFVAMPNINTIEEMGDLISTVRSYEANVTVIQATKEMIKKALEI